MKLFDKRVTKYSCSIGESISYNINKYYLVTVSRLPSSFKCVTSSCKIILIFEKENNI